MTTSITTKPMSIRTLLRTYYYLAKPGIVYGNSIAAIAGYFFGAAGDPNIVTFLSMLIGVALVMASACVFNNILDRDIDARMARTKRRALVSGDVPLANAIVYGTTLLVVGTLLLAYGTNLLTLSVALFGFIAYVGPYTYSKRKTIHSTLIGTLSGSTPPVIGYIAATNSFDMIAVLLFLVMVAWQMAHFYSIAIFRRDEYAAANLPILSVVKGVHATRQQITIYVVLFLVIWTVLGVYGTSLLTYLIVLLAGLYWLQLCLDRSETDVSRWARKQFGWSLWLLLIMSATLSLNSFFTLEIV